MKSKVMKRTFFAALAAIAATAAHAETYTYMCRVPSDHKSYPVKIDIDKATITWRGQTFSNLEQVDGCKAKYQATHDGETAEVCAATHGFADLTIGDASFDCRMR
jgi:hypothetical protein